MEKINGNMSIMDIMMTMSEGNPGALTILMQMIGDPTGILDILTCDSLEIRGSKLYMLWNDCCERNYAKFKRTLAMLKVGLFSQEEIQKNLSLTRAIPFIDDSIIVEGVPTYEEDFGFGDEKWTEFCTKQREAFVQKLSSIYKNKK